MLFVRVKVKMYLGLTKFHAMRGIVCFIKHHAMKTYGREGT
jgi:hypothetical protein